MTKTFIKTILVLLFGGFMLGFAFGSQGPAGHISKDHDQLTVVPEHRTFHFSRPHRPHFVHPHLHLRRPFHHDQKKIA